MIASDGHKICVRVFGPRTIAGEQGFILPQPRSASLKVEESARIWSLARSTCDELLVTHSELVIALMGDIVRVQSQRLSFATRSNTVMAG